LLEVFTRALARMAKGRPAFAEQPFERPERDVVSASSTDHAGIAQAPTLSNPGGA